METAKKYWLVWSSISPYSIPVLERITKTYQNYSGKNRRRKLSLASEFISSQISKYKKNSSESFKKVQEYAIEQDLLINKSIPNIDNDIDEISATKTFAKITVILSELLFTAKR